MKFSLLSSKKAATQAEAEQPVTSLLSASSLSDSLLQVLNEAALVTVTDAAGVVVYANQAFLQTSKNNLDTVLGQKLEIFKPGENNPLYKELTETISAGKVWRGEVKNTASDGTFFWTDSVVAPVIGEDGAIKNYAALHFVVTVHKEAENELEGKTKTLTEAMKEVESSQLELQKIRSATLNLLEDLDEEKTAVEEKVKERTVELELERNKLLQVTGNIRGGAILIDHTRKPVFVNRNVRKMLDLPEEDTSKEVVLDTFLKKFEKTEVATFFDTCKINETLTIPEAETGTHVFEIFFHGLEDVDKDGHVLPMYFILFSDITEAKLLERSKSELVAVASHQLRTPLTAMRGNVEMLIDESFGAMNKEQKELLHDIEESTIRLITMVNEMLDITKIERGDLEMTLENVDPVEVIDSIVSDLSDYALRHEFVINHHKPSEPTNVFVDKVRVRQVWQNIIDNAIKYSSHPGQLDIGYTIADGTVQISFKDNGIGIPEAEQSKMFGRFYRASNTAKTTSSGSGLGLYIVKSVVEQLGGSITFESTEGVGTTFYITLPTVKTEGKNE